MSLLALQAVVVVDSMSISVNLRKTNCAQEDNLDKWVNIVIYFLHTNIGRPVIINVFFQ